MIITPAIDLRAGRCVQLVGGSYDNERISLDDPVQVAADWERKGFKTLHVIDLDAATGAGSNQPIVEGIIGASSAEVQVGGGLRSSDAVARALDSGASCAILGTRAIEDRIWLETIAATYPRRVVVALDIRNRAIQVRGWQQSSLVTIERELEVLNALPLAAILVTAVHKEGAMQGTDLELMSEIVTASANPVQAAGGITTTRDIEALAQLGVDRAVVGMALYTGALDVSLIDTELKGQCA
jgi:phosphoribosylformimino-5-aminoimidazole carboxamide ribotide isomerase